MYFSRQSREGKTNGTSRGSNGLTAIWSVSSIAKSFYKTRNICFSGATFTFHIHISFPCESGTVGNLCEKSASCFERPGKELLFFQLLISWKHMRYHTFCTSILVKYFPQNHEPSLPNTVLCENDHCLRGHNWQDTSCTASHQVHEKPHEACSKDFQFWIISAW